MASRYTLNQERLSDWNKIYGVLVKSGEISIPTLDKIGSQSSKTNGSTIAKIQHIINQLFEVEDLKKLDIDGLENILGTFFLDASKQGGKRHERTLLISNHARSDEIRSFILDHLDSDYDSLDLFGYTNETLHPFIKTLPLHVRCVSRNWVKEREKETEFNKQFIDNTELRDKAPWQKSGSAKLSANQLALKGNSSCLSLEQKFYSMAPLLKGVIMFHSEDPNVKVGLLGFYDWIIDRVKGGSPYAGVRWSALKLDIKEEGENAFLLEMLHRRFNEIWKSDDTATYEEVRAEDAKFKHAQTAKTIWCMDGKLEYKIIIPGVKRGSKQRHYSPPFVNYYDTIASEKIKTFLKDNKQSAAVKIMELDYFPAGITGEQVEDQYEPLEADRVGWLKKHMEHYDGHLVFICKRTLSAPLRETMHEMGFPFEFEFNLESPDQIKARNRNLDYQSALDVNEVKDGDTLTDYCILGRCKRPDRDNGSQMFLIAGIHSLGTLGGCDFMTDGSRLTGIHDRLISQPNEDKNFGMIIRSIKKSLTDMQVETTVYEEPTWID